jgi:hypothetical protein
MDGDTQHSWQSWYSIARIGWLKHRMLREIAQQSHRIQCHRIVIRLFENVHIDIEQDFSSNRVRHSLASFPRQTWSPATYKSCQYLHQALPGLFRNCNKCSSTCSNGCSPIFGISLYEVSNSTEIWLALMRYAACAGNTTRSASSAALMEVHLIQ